MSIYITGNQRQKRKEKKKKRENHTMQNCDLDIKIPLALFKNQNEIVKVTLKDIIFTFLLLATCETFQTSQKKPVWTNLSIDVRKPF